MGRYCPATARGPPCATIGNVIEQSSKSRHTAWNLGDKVDSKPKVTVILPVYREPIDVIRRAADSVAAQTYGGLDVLMVLDDPQNVAAHDFLRAYCAERPGFSYKVNEKNMGLAMSLNAAMGDVATEGGLICRMDADDVAHPDRVERQVSYLLENGLDLVGCYMNVVAEDGTFLYKAETLPASASGVANALRYNNCVMHPTWLGRSEVLAKGYRAVPQSEDYDLLIRLELAGYRIGNCPETLLDYTISTGSISRSNLLRQYLYQRVLTKAYAGGRELDLDEATHEVESAWSPDRERRFARAYAMMNEFLGARTMTARIACVPRLIWSLLSSPDYVGKAYRLARTTLIAKGDAR